MSRFKHTPVAEDTGFARLAAARGQTKARPPRIDRYILDIAHPRCDCVPLG